MPEAAGTRVEQAKASFDHVEDEVGELAERARSNLKTLDSQLRAFVKERPFVALAGAIVGGYVVARLASRR